MLVLCHFLVRLLVCRFAACKQAPPLVELRHHWAAVAILRDGKSNAQRQSVIESNRPPKLTPEASIWGAGDECSPVRLSLIKETIDEYKDIVPDDRFDHMLAKRQPGPLEGKSTRR